MEHSLDLRSVSRHQNATRFLSTASGYCWSSVSLGELRDAVHMSSAPFDNETGILLFSKTLIVGRGFFMYRFATQCSSHTYLNYSPTLISSKLSLCLHMDTHLHSNVEFHNGHIPPTQVSRILVFAGCPVVASQLFSRHSFFCSRSYDLY